MPAAADNVLGNCSFLQLIGPTLTPVAVGANTTAEQTFVIPGLVPLDAVHICMQTAQAGLGIVNARVSANNTLAITFSNNTGGSITPTAGSYLIIVIRPDPWNLGINALPDFIV